MIRDLLRLAAVRAVCLLCRHRWILVPCTTPDGERIRHRRLCLRCGKTD